MSRRTAREMALQTLFLLDFNTGADQNEAVEAIFAERENLLPKTKEYTIFLVDGTKKHLETIDQHLGAISKEWALDRMSGVDRNLARMALFEMKYHSEPVDAGIVINEAVELSKIFGTENSGRFINGILSSALKEQKKDT
jgi:N utilization substance protein B